MFRRQRTLLALLEQFGGELSRTRLQKLLFLYCQRSGDHVYEFVPYKYGCFSFQAAEDLRKLKEKGVLADSQTWLLSKAMNTLGTLDYSTQQILCNLKKEFGDFSQEDLVRYVYNSFPYYSTRSQIAEKHLSKDALAKVSGYIPSVDETAILSIGYEGLSLEGYLNKLILRDVKIVCDVRKNPLSRKFGFSKRTLQSSLNNMDIEYRHIPELGIVSNKRQELHTQADYDELFDEYEKTTLIEAEDAVKSIFDLLTKKERIALLCYEKQPEQCHRTRIANKILKSFKGYCSVYTE